MIVLDDIKQIYGERCVLAIEHLHLLPGKRYAVMGPNGSGKSTLLRILAGVLAPTLGTVKVSARESIGYLPQQPYAFGFSVLKNVTMAMEVASEQAAMEALASVGMEQLAHASGRTLSGGETQRVALARMIVRTRPLLLLDEPTSATDMAGTDRVEQVLDAYCKNTGCTLVFSTHSPAQASRLASDIILLYDGRLVEQGVANSVLTKPQSEQAKAFLRYWQIQTEDTQC